MRMFGGFSCALVVFSAATVAPAGIITVHYSIDAGGSNVEPLNGLAALATWESSGDQLTILLENTSTGLPVGFGTADSLLVSLGFNLPDGINLLSGDFAVIGPDSVGLSQWSSRGPGDSVAEQWAWTNSTGGDLLSEYNQVVTTSQGNHGLTRFDGGSGPIGGPFGGIAANPILANIPGPQYAVSHSMLFGLTLSSSLSMAQLQQMAEDSIVEFGSDARYLSTMESSVRTPEPATLAMVSLLALPLFRRLRR